MSPPNLEVLDFLASVPISEDVDIMVGRQENGEVTFIVKSKVSEEEGNLGKLRLSQDEAVKLLTVIDGAIENFWATGTRPVIVYEEEGPMARAPFVW